MQGHMVRARRLSFLWLLLIPATVLAVVVTAAQIANAVRESPGANQWLRDNADAVANLAIRVESGGETTAFNGSCCYGVLQMNGRNIDAYANTTPDAYRQMDLQSQVNAWTRLTVDAMGASAPRTLASMSTFDGRPVDANLVLSCIQLGIGNCQRMLNSGHCGGFADSNGTTICDMADRMTGGASGIGVGGPTRGGISGPFATPGCPAGPGSCGSPGQSVEAGFQQGSGVSMGNLRSTIQAIVVAITLLVVGWTLLGLLRQYGNGVIAKPDLILSAQKALMIVVIIFIVITLV